MNRGFTLIEFAIVLVIIGVLIIGVLQGQDLVEQAKIRATISQLGRYDAALVTFRSKYNGQTPGDISKAVEYGIHLNDSGTNTTCLANASLLGDDRYNGNGNQILEDWDSGSIRYSGEITNFWIHLSNQNMIKQQLANSTAANCTLNSSDRAGGSYPADDGVGIGIIAVTHNSDIHYIVGGLSGVRTNEYIGGPVEATDSNIAHNLITPEQAFGIDSKIDNGSPNTGVVRVITRYATITTGSSQNHGELRGDPVDDATNCVYNGGYNLALDTNACTISVKEGSSN